MVCQGMVVSPFAGVWIDDTTKNKQEETQRLPINSPMIRATVFQSGLIWWYDWLGRLIVPQQQSTIEHGTTQNRLGIATPKRAPLSSDDLAGLIVSQKTATQETST